MNLLYMPPGSPGGRETAKTLRTFFIILSKSPLRSLCEQISHREKIFTKSLPSLSRLHLKATKGAGALWHSEDLVHIESTVTTVSLGDVPLGDPAQCSAVASLRPLIVFVIQDARYKMPINFKTLQ